MVTQQLASPGSAVLSHSCQLLKEVGRLCDLFSISMPRSFNTASTSETTYPNLANAGCFLDYPLELLQLSSIDAQ